MMVLVVAGLHVARFPDADRAGRAQALPPRVGRGVHGRDRRDRLHARAAPRVRRRPHRRDRQHHPQADARGQAAPERRVLVLARPLHDRVRARVPDLGRRARARRAGQERRLRLHQVTGWIGTLVSGTFLYVIAALNVVILLGIIKVFREMRTGRYDEPQLEEQLDKRGFMNRFLGGLTKTVTKPAQMYPIGVLFGLGFDTATEVALLVLAGGAAAAGLPWYAILCLPILFAAGMSLMDSIDGSFMNFAYGWAFSKPVRKVFYNITITGLSVAVAVVIGTIELGGLIASELEPLRRRSGTGSRTSTSTCSGS